MTVLGVAIATSERARRLSLGMGSSLLLLLLFGCGGAQHPNPTTCDEALAQERAALVAYLEGHQMDPPHIGSFVESWMQEHPSESEIAELEEVDEHTPGPSMEGVIHAMKARDRLCPEP